MTLSNPGAHVPPNAYLVFRSFSRYYILRADAQGKLSVHTDRVLGYFTSDDGPLKGGYLKRGEAEFEATMAMTDGKLVAWIMPEKYRYATLKRYYALRDGVLYRSTQDEANDSVLLESRPFDSLETFEPRAEEPTWPSSPEAATPPANRTVAPAEPAPTHVAAPANVFDRLAQQPLRPQYALARNRAKAARAARKNGRGGNMRRRSGTFPRHARFIVC